MQHCTMLLQEWLQTLYKGTLQAISQDEPVKILLESKLWPDIAQRIGQIAESILNQVHFEHSQKLFMQNQELRKVIHCLQMQSKQISGIKIQKANSDTLKEPDLVKYQPTNFGKLAELGDQLVRLQIRNQQLEQQLSRYKEKHSSQKFSALENKLFQLQLSANKLKSQSQYLSIKLRQAVNQNSTYQLQNAEYLKQRQDLYSRIEEFDDRAKRLSSENTRLLQSQKMAKFQCIRMHTQIVDLSDKLKSSEKQLLVFKIKNYELAQEISKLQSSRQHLLKLTKDNQCLNQKVGFLQQRLSVRDKQLKYAKATLQQGLSQERSKVASQISTQIKQLQSAEKERTTFLQKKLALEKQLIQKHYEQKYNIMVLKLKDREQELKKRVGQLQQQLLGQVKKAKQLQRRTTDLAQRLARSEQDYNSQLELAKQSKDQLQSERQTLKLRLSSVSVMLQKQKSSNQRHSAMLEEYQKLIVQDSQAKAQVAGLSQEIHRLSLIHSNQKDCFEKQIFQQRKAVANLQEQSVRLKGECCVLEQRLHGQRERAKAINAKFQQLQCQYQLVKTQYQQEKQKFLVHKVQLQNKLSDMQTLLETVRESAKLQSIRYKRDQEKDRQIGALQAGRHAQLEHRQFQKLKRELFQKQSQILRQRQQLNLSKTQQESYQQQITAMSHKCAQLNQELKQSIQRGIILAGSLRRLQQRQERERSRMNSLMRSFKSSLWMSMKQVMQEFSQKCQQLRIEVQTLRREMLCLNLECLRSIQRKVTEYERSLRTKFEQEMVDKEQEANVQHGEQLQLYKRKVDNDYRTYIFQLITKDSQSQMELEMFRSKALQESQLKQQLVAQMNEASDKYNRLAQQCNRQKEMAFQRQQISLQLQRKLFQMQSHLGMVQQQFTQYKKKAKLTEQTLRKKIQLARQERGVQNLGPLDSQQKLENPLGATLGNISNVMEGTMRKRQQVTSPGKSAAKQHSFQRKCCQEKSRARRESKQNSSKVHMALNQLRKEINSQKSKLNLFR